MKFNMGNGKVKEGWLEDYSHLKDHIGGAVGKFAISQAEIARRAKCVRLCRDFIGAGDKPEVLYDWWWRKD